MMLVGAGELFPAAPHCLNSPNGWHHSLTQQIEFLLEEALSGAAKKPQNDQQGDTGSRGKS